MQKFMQLYPHIEIELNSNDQVIDLLQHKTDVAIRFGALHDSSLHARLICKSRLYIVASPDYLKKLEHRAIHKNCFSINWSGLASLCI